MSWLGRFLAAWREEPQAEAPRGEPVQIAAVEAVLAELRPLVEADGGRLQLVAVEDGWVAVRLGGACRSCHAQEETLREALEPRLRAELPWVRGVRPAGGAAR